MSSPKIVLIILDFPLVLITHDLGVVANTCSRIIVLYGGMIMEEGSEYKYDNGSEYNDA